MAKVTIKPYPKDHPIFSGKPMISVPVSRPSTPSSLSGSPEAVPVPPPDELSPSTKGSPRPKR